MRNHTARYFVAAGAILALALPVAVGTVAANVPATTLHHLGADMTPPPATNGIIRILVRKDGPWAAAGELAFTKFMEERSLDLTGYLPEEGSPVVRIVQEGGNAAYLDRIRLGDAVPVGVAGTADPLALVKMERTDEDLVDMYGRTLDLTFPQWRGDGTLYLAARIVGDDLSKRPLIFPRENVYGPMSGKSNFYRYRLRGEGKETAGHEPFLGAWAHPGSGHPAGIVEGRVSNDEENLYIHLDVTPDNTMDGALDYARVYVRTPSGLRDYTITTEKRRWGTTRFTYTGLVPYQHKIYNFAIPLAQVASAQDAAVGNLDLAFEIYGTVVILPTNSRLHAAAAYDPVNDRYLVTYTKVTPGDDWDIMGRFVDNAGAPIGTEFPIASGSQTETDSAVVYDEAGGRFLVVWSDGTNNWEIRGRFVEASDTGGTLFGAPFAISDSSAEIQWNPAVAWDDSSQKALVVWSNSLSASSTTFDIYGQFVNASGSPSLLYSSNFPVSTAVDDQNYPSAAFDTDANRFLVVWNDRRTGGDDIRGQIVDFGLGGSFLFSTAASDNLPVSVASEVQALPRAAYSSTTGRFLVVWQDSRGAGVNAYGQLIDAASGAPYGTSVDTNFPVSLEKDTQVAPVTAAGGTGGEAFLVVFESLTGPESDMLGQVIDTNGSAVSTSVDVNFTIAATGSVYLYPDLVYNPARDNFLVVFHDESVSPYELVTTVWTAPSDDGGGGGGGGGGGCNTAGSHADESPWWGALGVLLIAGMFFALRRRV